MAERHEVLWTVIENLKGVLQDDREDGFYQELSVNSFLDSVKSSVVAARNFAREGLIEDEVDAWQAAAETCIRRILAIRHLSAH